MKFKITNQQSKESVKAYIDRLPEGKIYNADIKLYRKPRTVSQNALYWLWIGIISDDVGISKEDLHQAFLQKFIGISHTNIFDEDIPKYPSTKNLNTKQMSEYMLQIEAYMLTEYGVVLPHPEDQFFNEIAQQYL